MTPSGIAYSLIRERHDITTLVGRMKRDGYVDLEPNPGDRRSVYVILTDQGRENLANWCSAMRLHTEL